MKETTTVGRHKASAKSQHVSRDLASGKQQQAPGDRLSRDSPPAEPGDRQAVHKDFLHLL